MLPGKPSRLRYTRMIGRLWVRMEQAFARMHLSAGVHLADTFRATRRRYTNVKGVVRNTTAAHYHQPISVEYPVCLIREGQDVSSYGQQVSCESGITRLVRFLTNPTPAPMTDAPPATAFLLARTVAKKAIVLIGLWFRDVLQVSGKREEDVCGSGAWELFPKVCRLSNRNHVETEPDETAHVFPPAKIHEFPFHFPVKIVYGIFCLLSKRRSSISALLWNSVRCRLFPAGEATSKWEWQMAL